MSVEAALQSLAQSKIFRGLTAGQVSSIYERGRTASFGPGEVLIGESQPNSDLYVVVDGELVVYLPQTEERFSQVRLGTLGPGDCIGEYSLVDKKPASASVAARRPTEVFRISHLDFDQILESDSGIGHAIYKNLLEALIDRLRQQNQSLDLFRPA
jgi:CRP-like cAMP-binding protein